MPRPRCPDRRGDLPAHDESRGDADGFSEDAGRAREAFRPKREESGQAVLRISIVLGNEGGAFPVMRKLTRLAWGSGTGESLDELVTH